ncbi:MAG: bifunctional demethylmenaquinone methyltransferase/2-methoxy-6-polyprenyl-1,4-benzoquinol methylase UbiE [Alphaproteobacteria bacterium]
MRMSMEQTTHFGYSTVNLEEKAGLVQSLFSDVAVSYDLMNDVMSFGVHRIWKDALINWVKPQKGQAFLDLAGGTGDIAFRISKATSGKQKDITVCDLTPAMLLEGKKRAEKTIDLGQISWVAGDAMDLPFATNSFDVVTMAFGLRNVAVQDKAIEEIYRVLRPGGRFFCLEFSKVVLPLLDKAYDAFSFRVIPLMGQMIANDRTSYQYLVESIRQFPDQETLSKMFLSQGFDRSSYQNLSGGIAAIHQGIKI